MPLPALRDQPYGRPGGHHEHTQDAARHGTLWAIDASGAPHLFDPIRQQWQPFGTGINAVAYMGSDIYHFRGSEYVKVTFGANQTQSPPVSIGTTWPKLPYSFTLEDVISAVAAFFKKLGKAIENVIQALSILFHLNEIKKTHKLLCDKLLPRVNGDASNSTTYPGLVNAIKGNVKPNIDSFFDGLETHLNVDGIVGFVVGALAILINIDPNAAPAPT